MRKKFKRLLALILTLATAFSLLSAAAWATGSDEQETEAKIAAAWDAQQSESVSKQAKQVSEAAEDNNSTTTNSTESGQDTSIAAEWGLDLPIYKANVIVDNTSVQESIQSNMNTTMPAEKLVDMLHKNSTFMASVAAWKTATFDASNTADDALKEVDYYEATLMNMLNVSMTSDEFTDAATDQTWKNVLAITEHIMTAAAKFEEIDSEGYGLFSQMKDWMKSHDTHSISYETVEEIKAFSKEMEQNYTIVGDGANYASIILDASTDLYDFAKKFAAYEELLSISDNTIAVLEEMYQQCPAENLAMKTALLNVKENCKASALSAILNTMNTTVTIGKTLFRVSVGELWSAMIATQGPFALGALVGQAIGKTMSNILFSTDKTIDFYFQMNAYTELMDLTRTAYANMKTAYTSNRTSANAGNYLDALKLMYGGFTTGCDYASDFADIVYTTGIWNKITHADQSKDYIEFVASCDNIKLYISQNYQSIADQFWRFQMQEDYPELYNLLTNRVAFEEPEEEQPKVPVTGIKFTTDARTISLNSTDIYWADYEILPENATTKTVSFTSSDPEIVTIEGFLGLLKPQKVGTATITAKTEDGEFTATQTVTVVEGDDANEEETLVDSGTCGKTLTWGLTKDGTLYIRGTGAMTNWYYRYYAPWYDNRSKIKKVQIGKGVTSIGDSAFEDCYSLTSITIPDSVTSIGNHAFRHCSSLASITIPNSVTSIGDSAFGYCSSLTSITIPDSVTSIGNSAFSGCDSLTSITIPDSVTSIGYDAFFDCSKLISITIPDSVTSIGISAFSDCDSLTSITIPDSVTSIGYDAFFCCSSLADVYITNMDAWCKISFSNAYSNPLNYAENLYLNGTPVKEVTIPDDVTEIGPALLSCSSLERVTIPDSVTSIGELAFYGCSSLASITIPDSVTSIGNYAFYRCNSLTDVYYAGSEADWTAIEIGSYNTSLTNATIHFGSSGPVANSLADCTITLERDSYTYDGNEKKPAVTVKDGDTTLVLDTDYTVAYQDNTNAGTATVIIAGKGNYTGTVTKTFTIQAAVKTALSKCTATLSKTSYTYNGKAQKPAVTVKNGSTTLTKDTDYTAAYKNNTNVGTATVTITGKGNYTGTVTKTFKIVQADQAITAKSYTKTLGDKAFSLGAKTNGSGKLTYKSSNTKVATISSAGKITIKGVGSAKITITAAATKNYKKAVKSVTITVNPTGTKLASVTNLSGKKMKITWKKNSKVTGYQIQYSTSSKFSSPKTVTVKSYKTTSSTISNLTKNKKYYVRIRTYKTVSGKNYYSSWSGSKNITIKK